MRPNPSLPQRRTVRLKGFDYSQPGAYFVTICTHKRECLLGSVQDGIMALSRDGRIAEMCWRALPQDFRGLELDVFVVMPNHIHGVILITEVGNYGDGPPPGPPRGTLPGSQGAVVQNFKSVSTRKINQGRACSGGAVWQRNYYEHVVRDEEDLNAIRRYIVDNPARWERDEYNSHT